MIKQWTKQSVSEFHKALRKVVEDFAETQGVMVVDRSGSYRESEYCQGFRFTISAQESPRALAVG